MLPSRKPGHDRYQGRADELVAGVPAPDQVVVRRYARWAVTRLLHERVMDGAVPAADVTRWPLTRIRVAAQFTTVLARAGQCLKSLTQSQLDAGVAELPSTAPALRAFVLWAVAHKYMTPGLEVAGHDAREDRSIMDDSDRPGLAWRLMRGDARDPADRFAAVLILLFEQFATTAGRLRTGAVTADDDGRVFLSLGETAIRLREPLAHLALTVADRASDRDSPWLFPGGRAR